MVLVNWLALGLATFCVAVWLRRRGTSPWLALLVGLYPGFLLGVQRDLTEPLAYALAAAGIIAFDRPGPGALALSSVLFGLSGLARQTTIVFPLCLVLVLVLRRQRLRAAAFGAVSIMPIVAYTAFLDVWLGSIGGGSSFEWLPFEGLVTSREWQAQRQGVVIVAVLVPALLATAAALVLLRRGLRRVELGYLLVNTLLFVVFLSSAPYGDGYTSVGRVSVGVVLAAVFCAPLLRAAGPRVRLAGLAAGVLWMSMLPVITVYGFGG